MPGCPYRRREELAAALDGRWPGVDGSTTGSAIAAAPGGAISRRAATGASLERPPIATGLEPPPPRDATDAPTVRRRTELERAAMEAEDALERQVRKLSGAE